MHILFFMFLGVCSSYMNIGNKNFLIMKKDCGLTNYLYTPKTENQKSYVKYLESKDDYILSVIGPAGTGKTLLACNKAINELKKKTIDKIIITRPVVSVEEELGFLPGNIEKKMEPWTRPIFDIFLEIYSKKELSNMIRENIIEISPLCFMRGRTFKNSFIIADEMQNSTPNQMRMLLTRIGTNSRMVITGDLAQSDRIENNGLKDFINKLKNSKIPDNIYLIEMEYKDVQRSKLVNDILNLYNSNQAIEETLNQIINEIPINKIIKYDTTENGNSDAALIPKKHMKKIL